MNTSYKGKFLRHIVDHSDSRIFIIAYEFLDRLKLIVDDLKNVEEVVVLGGIQKQEASQSKIPIMSFGEVFDSSENPVDVVIYSRDPLSIIYASGTTGLSEGALGPCKFWVVCAEKMFECREGG